MDVKIIEFAYGRLLRIRERSPGAATEKSFLHIHIGNPLPDIIGMHRKNIPSSTYLLYFYPEAEGAGVEDLYGSLGADERILFSPVDKDMTHIEVLSMALSLLKIEPDRISITKNNELENSIGEEIERIKTSANSFLSNMVCENRSRLLHLRCSIHNLPLMISNGVYRIEKKEGRPDAVVCGAGPSLSKHFEILKGCKGKILIIAVGHAYAVLHGAGIEPDFVVEIDSESQMNWRRHNLKPECPLVAVPLVAPETARRFEKIIWAREPFSSFSDFLKEAGIFPEALSLSRSVIVTALDFAVKMGCRRIALAGSDLCMSETGSAHVKTSVYDDNENPALVEIKGNDGKKVFTVRGFEGIKESLQNYLFSAKRQDNAPEIFNCTEGGAYIENAGRMSLADFCRGASSSGFDLNPGGRTELTEKREYIISVRNALAEYLKTLEAMLDISRKLLRELKNSRPQMEKLELYRSEFRKAAECETEIKGRTSIRDIIVPVSEQADEILIHCRGRSGDDAVSQIEVFRRRYELIYSLCADIKNDFDFILDANVENEGPYSFAAFRKFALSFIARHNQEFAGFLEKSFSAPSDKFKVLTNQLYLPFVRIALEGGNLFGLNSFIAMESFAGGEVNDFVKESGFDVGRNAVVFFAPGNWAHVVEFSKMHPGAEFLVVEPWPELLSAIISHAMFMHYLPEKTIVIGMHEELKKWKRVYHNAIREWKRQGRGILFFRHPRTWQLPEIQEKLKELPS